MKSTVRSTPAWFLTVVLWLSCVGAPAGKAFAQESKTPATVSEADVSKPEPQPATATYEKDHSPSRFERRLLPGVLQDQKAIWTSPKDFRARDLKWFVPVGTVTGLSFAYDPEISRRFVNKGTHVDTFRKVSDAGVLSFAVLGGAMYLSGVVKADDRKRETGVLMVEAVADSLAFGSALKYSLQRERPGTGSGQGEFFATTSSPSFPSEHSLVAWSAASVVAHEYPGWATKLGAYGLASAVSIARVAGDKHYASDVLVGSVAGYFIGRHVYKAHHERDLDVLDYGTFDSSPPDDGARRAPEEGMLPYAQGSVYVPLDSWIYPALRRLSALGLISTQTLGMAPWTRAECLRQVEEAEDVLNQEARLAVDEEDDRPAEARKILSRLKQEFAEDSEGSFQRNYSALTLESVYARVGGISGPPLRDGFNFGQTIVNDFGRPFGQGLNAVTGFSARGRSGRFAFYFRGEYQHGAAAPPLPDAARIFIRDFDQTSLPPVIPFPETDRVRINEAYVEGYFGNLDFTAGKQALWWGSSAEMGPWLYSNNAEPIYMFRFNNRTPWKIPLLGRMRAEFFLGKASGRTNPARPLVQGQKVTFKPFKDLEVGFSRSITFGGAGRQPFTLGSFWTAFSSVGDNPLADLPGHDPGDRRGGFDFTYRLPGLRKWGATLYGDGMTDDDPSPLGAGALNRTAWSGGLYLARLPSIARMDLRLEGATSAVVTTSPGHFVYFNSVYKDGYVNNQNLIGNWVGRQGVGFSATANYWLSPASRIELAYRRLKPDSRFLPGGGTQNDFALRSQWRIRPELELSGYVQHERWLLPILSAQRESNWATAVQITIFPQKSLWRSRIASSDSH